MKRAREKGRSSKQQKLAFAAVAAARPVSTVDEAVKCLAEEGYSHVREKERIIHSLLTVQHESNTKGLSSENIIVLIKVIGSQKFNQKISKKLIKCLVPKQNVPEDAAISVISRIGTQQLPIKTQADLLKWVVTIYDYFTPLKNLPYLYGIIFDFMEYDTLAPFASQLLCRMSEKYLVVPFRIRRLMDIQLRVGSLPHILALLSVFTYHRPDLLTVQCNFRLKSFSRPVVVLPPLLDERRHADQQLEKRKIDKQKAHAAEIMVQEKIYTLAQLHASMQNLENLKGLFRLLSSPTRRIIFTSGLPTSVLSQFYYWLRHSLALEKPLKKYDPPLYSDRGDLLLLVADLSTELQEGIPEVESFVRTYVTRWDGHSHLGLLLDIIQYWKFCTFESLLESVLLPMYKYYCASPVACKCSVLECYTNLYQRWVLWEVQRHEACRGVAANGTLSKHHQKTVFGQEFRSGDSYSEIQSLASYIDTMCVVALQLHPDHPPALLYQIMKFFDVMIDVHSRDSKAPLVMPSPIIVCAAILAGNAATVSHLCQLILNYKKTVNILRLQNAEALPNPLISNMNGCLLDICNILWRCRAFGPNEKSLLFHKELPLHILQSVPDAPQSFCLYHHPAFYGFALDFVHKSEVEISLKKLLNDEVVRDAYLAHLSDSGLKEITSFIYTFITPKAS